VPRRKTFPDNPCEPISKSTSNPSNSCYSNFTLICPNKLVALKDALPDFSDAATPHPLRQQSLSMRLTRTSSSSRRLDRATGSTALDRHAVKHVKNLPIPFPRFRARHVFTTPHLRSRLCHAICTSPHARALSGSTHNRSRWMLASLAVLTPPLPARTWPSFHLIPQLALRSMRALAIFTLSALNADLLAVVLPTLACVTLQADMLLFAFFDWFLAECPQIVHLALLTFVGLPPMPCLISSGSTRAWFSPPAAPCDGSRSALRARCMMACARWHFLMCWGTS
jgi:hypothetical protein